jgi:hypothetical protein
VRVYHRTWRCRSRRDQRREGREERRRRIDEVDRGFVFGLITVGSRATLGDLAGLYGGRTRLM